MGVVVDGVVVHGLHCVCLFCCAIKNYSGGKGMIMTEPVDTVLKCVFIEHQQVFLKIYQQDRFFVTCWWHVTNFSNWVWSQTACFTANHKVQDYQQHTCSITKKHEPLRSLSYTRWIEFTTQQGYFDGDHQLMKLTESVTCPCNLQQKVQHWKFNCHCEGGEFQQHQPIWLAWNVSDMLAIC